jgi:hypothetical protein
MAYDEAVDAGCVGSIRGGGVVAVSSGSGFDKIGCAGARFVVGFVGIGGVEGDTLRVMAGSCGDGVDIGEAAVIATSQVNGSAWDANRKLCKKKTTPMAKPPCSRQDATQPAVSGFVRLIGCCRVSIMADG